MLRYEGFFPEAAGPGWALAGDAGYSEDPTLPELMRRLLAQGAIGFSFRCRRV